MGCILGITGGLIRVWCHRTLGRFFTWEMAVLDDHKLATTVPYAIVRHPSYTGWLIMVSGDFLLLFTGEFAQLGIRDTMPIKCFVVLYLTYLSGALLHRMGTEDEVMRREFGEQWTAWARKTPYNLVPFVY